MRYVPVGVVVALLLSGACAQHASSAVAPSPAPSSSTPVASRPPAAPALSAPYLAAAPLLRMPSGPADMPKRPCRPAIVTATAVTKAIAGGVAGVITMKGADCSLFISSGPIRLLDASGRGLAVPLDAAAPRVNPPQNVRPDLALYEGDATWGFTWTGSWCGATAASVVVPMTADPNGGGPAGPYGDLDVPLSGPQPGCHGASGSVLRPGVPGSGIQAVLPPSPTWAQLQATVGLAATVGDRVPPYTLTLHNPTSTAITLSPCPAVGTTISVSRAGPGWPSASDSSEATAMNCTQDVVAPGASTARAVAHVG